MEMSENLHNIIEDLVGKFTIIYVHRPKSTRTGVFEILANGNRYFVKIYNRLSRWHPEVYAYENWTNCLGDYAPKLVCKFCDNDLFGIITTPIKGKTVNEFAISDIDILSKIYYSAGECLKKQHDLQAGSYFGIPFADGTPLEKNNAKNGAEYIVEILADIQKQGCDNGLFSVKEQESINWALNNSHCFSASEPMPTNWDFSPQNWMCQKDGNFTGIIDFEKMLWGLDYDSFGVLIERYVPQKPKLRESFFEGYGLRNTDEEIIKLKVISIKIAAIDVVFGTSINEDRIVTLAHSLFETI